MQFKLNFCSITGRQKAEDIPNKLIGKYERNNQTLNEDVTHKMFKKILLVMKLTVFFILIFTAGVFANASSQTINLSARNITLERVFNTIETTTGYVVFCDYQIIKKTKKIDVDAKNENLISFLDKVLKQEGLSYHIEDKTIIISQDAPIEGNNKKSLSGNTVGKAVDITVTGTVKNENGENLPGAVVTVQGTKHSVITTINGTFSIGVPNINTAVLEVSMIGYKTIEIPITGRNDISVVLTQEPKNLNEIVVVGYGTQSKTRVTGAISSIKSKDLESYASTNFGDQMVGKAAGVQVNESTGLPGSDPQIIIRGVSTITAGINPLIVVDGFPLSEGTSLNAINPQDIATIDILKDPSSAAIYGSRAANGVILITTKSAGKDKMNVAFDAYTGFQQRSDKVKLENAYQYALYSTEARDWGYVSKDPTHRNLDDDVATRKANGATARDYRLHYIEPYLENQPGLTNTNWLDAIFKSAPINNYNLSFSGSNGKTNYYVSANYANQQGIVVNTGLVKYSGEIKINSKPTDWLNMGINLNPSYNRQKYFDGSYDPVVAAANSYPFFPVYNADGSLAISEQIVANTPEDGALQENPVAMMKLNTYDRDYFRNFGNGFLEFKILKDLKFKTMLGGDYISTYINYYSPSYVGGYRAAAPKPAIAQETDGQVWNYITENTFTYAKTFGKHDLNVLAGYSFQKENGNSTFISGTNIPDDNLQNISGATNFSVSKSAYTWTQLSYLGRIEYAYANKYLLTAAIRRDGSSRFGADSKYGDFPSVTAGWLINEEDFMKNISWIDQLKLRGSWGKAGNNQIPNYGAQALVNQDNYVYGNTLAPGYAATTAPNSDLSWETKTAYNIGFDASVFKHFSASFNYYSTTTSDLLLNIPVPEQSGYNNSLQNIGKVRNSGVELELSGDGINLGKVKWSYGATFTTNKNTVLSLGPGQDQILSGSPTSFQTKVGGPIAELYGYDVTGIYKTQQEIDNTPHMAGTVVGDYVIKDLNGDGQITADDRKGFGTYAPKDVYSFSSSFNYKNFDFSFSLNGVTGRKIYNNGLWLMESGESFTVGDEYYFKHRWDPNDNPNGFLARPTTNLSADRQSARVSNEFFYNADYLRIRDIQLGYNFSSDLLKRYKISELRIYVSANNPFTFTKYRGYNPDATSTDNNVLTSGYAYNYDYPIAKSYMIGLHLVF